MWHSLFFSPPERPQGLRKSSGFFLFAAYQQYIATCSAGGCSTEYDGLAGVLTRIGRCRVAEERAIRNRGFS
ncbi:hypothetical protein BJX63DRAFT_376002 [Aspergillus granulosus]|uniref:Uncharacterized protein n=1 Tax=Aspergillus granulosus TaxID=176169 RepID=A0ABR4I5E8_9EURO